VPVPHSAPANLLATVTGSTLALSWKNTYTGGAATSFMLDVAGSLSGSIPLPYGESASFPGVPGGTYNLSLRAVNAGGASTPSNTVVVTLPGVCSGAPQTPTNFLAYKIGSTISVVWEPPLSGPAPASYTLIVTGSFNGNIMTPARALSGAVGPGTYNLSVAATNACGSGAATAVQTIAVP
jgi:hypothetical protein